jgi:hypothetical protein
VIRTEARRSLLKSLAVCFVIVGTAAIAAAQPQEYETNPREFVRTAVYNEAHAHSSGEHFMWKDIDKKPKGTTTKLMVETKDGVISRLIAIDGRAPNTQERAQDDGRVNRLLTDPSALRKKQQEQKEDEARVQKLLSAIPDAFIFKYLGVEEGKSGKVVRYTFTPDPNFNAPSRETRVFEGMKGTLLIDLDAKRIAMIDGSLFQPVEFGWGILGKLDRGGRFVIEQHCVGGPRWETTHSYLRFTGKALMVKTINIQEDETLTDFQRVGSDLTVAQGIDLMKKADDVVAENGGGNGQK